MTRPSKAAWNEAVRQGASDWHGVALDAAAVEHHSELLAGWRDVVRDASDGLSLDPEPATFAAVLQAAAPPPVASSGRMETAPFRDVGSPLDLDLVEVAQAIRRKAYSSEEVTRAALARLESVHAETNLSVSIDADGALEAARMADRALARQDAVGPLHGVPLAHKDLFYVAGRPAHCGGKARAPAAATKTATAIQRLAGAGALNLGRLHMTEFAFDPTGLNQHFGACGNPWDLTRLPGGSSSGSGVAVATRAVFAALGSDTGGSIRLPAALCGVTGLKPTYGRVSRAGAMALSFSNDHVGPMARTARDCARILSVVAGRDVLDLTSSPLPSADYEDVAGYSMETLRVGVPDRFFRQGLLDTHAAALDNSLHVFERLGARVVAVPDFDYGELNVLASLVTRAEAGIGHLRALRERPEDYSPSIRHRFEEGIGVPAAVYLQALSLRSERLIAFLSTVMANVHVLHAPVVRIDAPRIEDAEEGSPLASGIAAELTLLTRPFNFLGLPVLSLPCGFTKPIGGQPLPVGLQLIGRPFAESTLLAAGMAFQDATAWHRDTPTHAGA